MWRKTSWKEICIQHSQCVVSKQHGWLYMESKLEDVESISFWYVDSMICLFIFDRTARTDSTEVSTFCSCFGGFKPHIFNLTGQLESIPPEFPTLAATDLMQLDVFCKRSLYCACFLLCAC